MILLIKPMVFVGVKIFHIEMNNQVIRQLRKRNTGDKLLLLEIIIS